jgi:hypothetical protein
VCDREIDPMITLEKIFLSRTAKLKTAVNLSPFSVRETS